MYIHNEDEEPAFLCSNSGWGQTIDFINGLDNAPPELSSFANSGASTTPQVMQEEITALIDSETEIDEDVQNVLQSISDFIGDSEVVLVSNGMISSSESDDESET